MENLNIKIKNLITRLLAGEATNAEKNQLDQWLAESSQNQEFFEEYKKTWSLKLPNYKQIKINRSNAWESITQKIEQEEAVSEPPVIPIYRSSRTFFYAITAIAAMILLFWGIYTFLPKSTEIPLISYHHTDLSETGLFILPDGTVVYFNGEGTVSYPDQFAENERNVEFSGNAFFDVAKMEEMPFVVSMREASLEVLGTSFDIRQQTDWIAVSVISGKVAFIPDNGEKLVLNKGQRGIYNLNTGKMRFEEIPDYNFLAWKTKRLEFTEAGLDKVFEDLMQAYPISIEWPEEVSEKKLTARFENEKHETILSSIEILFDVKIREENGMYKVSL